ncbi:MAG: hypothetical protein FGM39_09600 [Phycisphaerales bacterium]|nr:hypothetical protein [Phycisphaerales bacterium]
MTMNGHDDIQPDDGRDPGRMGADERRAELACILARGLRGAIIEHRTDWSLSREIHAVSAPACLDLSPDRGSLCATPPMAPPRTTVRLTPRLASRGRHEDPRVPPPGSTIVWGQC